jgi:hypothetical protein
VRIWWLPLYLHFTNITVIELVYQYLLEIVEEDYLTEALDISEPVLVPADDAQRILARTTWKRLLQPGNTYHARSRHSSSQRPMSRPTPPPSSLPDAIFNSWSVPSTSLYSSSSSSAPNRSSNMYNDGGRKAPPRDIEIPMPARGIGGTMKVRARQPVADNKRKSEYFIFISVLNAAAHISYISLAGSL